MHTCWQLVKLTEGCIKLLPIMQGFAETAVCYAAPLDSPAMPADLLHNALTKAKALKGVVSGPVR